MNTSKFKKIIKEAMVEALNEHYKDIMLEVLRGNKQGVYQSNVDKTTTPPNKQKTKKVNEDFFNSYKEKMKNLQPEDLQENKQFNSNMTDVINGELPTDDLPLENILQMTS